MIKISLVIADGMHGIYQEVRICFKQILRRQHTGWLKLNAQYSEAHSSGSTGRIRMKFKTYVM